jgi:NADP-dependent 3-hydroxy acid dehydrogenase YdfG
MIRAGTALVVGASSTIGRAIAVELSGHGFRPALWGRNSGALLDTAQACDGGADVAVVDVLDDDAVRKAAAAVERPLRVVVYAAGRFEWADAVTDPPLSQAVMEVNLGGAVRVTQAVLSALVDAAPSSLIFLGSGAATVAFPHNAAYVASKHGLAGYARAVWQEIRDDGVKVSLINPGLVLAGAALSSPAAGQRPERFLQPADVAAAVRFVVTFPDRGCPVQIDIQPQRQP